MSEPTPVRRSTDPLVLALAAGIREIAARRAAEQLERRRRMTVVGASHQGDTRHDRSQEASHWVDEDTQNRQLFFRHDPASNKWTVTVNETKPVAFEYGTGWMTSTEEAASQLVGLLEAIGETFQA